jgi:ubiquinone/menaquinone biosynthesis C-methylase UbiE
VVDLKALYAKHARRFDQVRTGCKMERPYLDKVSSLAPPPGKVLDLGCGSGEPIARYFVEKGYQVTGVDAVSEMLAMGRERFPAMSWRQADMRELTLGELFDIVIAWDSFFHLTVEDQRGMFTTFRQHSAPGGVLLFTSGLTEGEAVGGDLFGDLLYHASLDTAEYARQLDAHGYDVVLHQVEDPDCGGHTVWIGRLRGEHTDGSLPVVP